jgi:hypothetical protein
MPLGCKKYSTKLFSLAMVLWSLWSTRKKMVMEGVVLQRLADMFYKIFSCTQRWQLRLKLGDQEHQTRWVAQLRGWVDDLENKMKSNAQEEIFI